MVVPLRLALHDFLEKSQVLPVIDVRSPGEFAKGHIPGAVNIPLFDDVERAEIGTLYKARGKQEAVMRGIALVSPKLSDFIQSSIALNPERKALIYCYRGGMRSNSFATLLLTAGIQAEVLNGGYKAFRKAALDCFASPRKLCLVGGATGSGKTAILQAIHQKGKQVLDLEDLAHHSGSAFGAIGKEKQPSQQQFENKLFLQMIRFASNSPVWLEDESFSIGSVRLPYAFWLQMRAANVYMVQLPMRDRVKRLIAEYGQVEKECIKQILDKLGKRLGAAVLAQLNSWVEEGRAEEVTERLLLYYDASYAYETGKREKGKLFPVLLQEDHPEKNADLVLEEAARQGDAA